MRRVANNTTCQTAHARGRHHAFFDILGVREKAPTFQGARFDDEPQTPKPRSFSTFMNGGVLVLVQLEARKLVGSAR